MRKIGPLRPGRSVARPHRALADTFYTRFTQSHQTGFTLIEILIVIGLFSLLIALGLTLSLDSYRNYLLRADVGKAHSLLLQARSRAMNNYNQSAHVFKITHENYQLYAEQILLEVETLERSKNVQINPNIGTYQFEQLTGNAPSCSPACTLRFSNGNLSKTITINATGGILLD